LSKVWFSFTRNTTWVIGHRAGRCPMTGIDADGTGLGTREVFPVGPGE
jgi:hypothetical protein